MQISQRLAEHPTGDMREYFAGTGHFVMVGAVLMVTAFYADKLGFGPVVWAACAIGALASGWSGLKAMGRFIASAHSRVFGAFLAVLTSVISVFFGGIFGVMGVAVIRTFVFG